MTPNSSIQAGGRVDRVERVELRIRRENFRRSDAVRLLDCVHAQNVHEVSGALSRPLSVAGPSSADVHELLEQLDARFQDERSVPGTSN